MRVLIWCLEATGTAMMVLAYLLLFTLDSTDLGKGFAIFTLMLCILGYVLKVVGEDLHKGGAALKAMSS